jgi:hypothetical protein
VTFSPWIDYWGNSLNHDGGQPPVNVPATQLSRIVSEQQFENFALICDIEGEEYDLVMRDIEVLGKAKLIIMETHPHFIGETKVHYLLATLEGLGFKTLERSALVVVLKK